MSELTEQLRRYGEAVERFASASPPPPHWANPEPSRHRRRMAGAVAALVAVAALSVAIAQRDGKDEVTLVSDGADLPHLLADVPWLSPFTTTSYDGPGFRRSSRVTVFAQPDLGLSGPVLFVKVVPTDAVLGIDTLPQEGTFDVNGAEARLSHRTALATTLGWRLPDGSGAEGVVLGAVRMSDDELLTAARSLHIEGGATGTLGAGFEEVLWFHPSDGAPSSVVASEFTAYDGPFAGAGLRVDHGTARPLADLAMERAMSATEMATVPVRGTTGVVLTHPDGRRYLLWADRDGYVAELTVYGEAVLEEAASSVREVTRQALQTRAEDAAGERDDGLPSSGSAIGISPTQLCTLRDGWLFATSASEQEVKRSDVDFMIQSIERSETGRDHAQADDLAEAMRSGDPRAVNSVSISGCPSNTAVMQSVGVE